MAWCTFWFCIILNIGWVHVCLLLFHDIISLLFFSQSDWVEFSHGACWSYASPVSNRFLFFFFFGTVITLFLLAHTHTYQALWVVDMLGSWSWPWSVFWQVRCMAAAGGTWFSEGRLHGELPVVSICNNRWSAFLYAAWAQRCPVFERNKIIILIFVDQNFIECSTHVQCKLLTRRIGDQVYSHEVAAYILRAILWTARQLVDVQQSKPFRCSLKPSALKVMPFLSIFTSRAAMPRTQRPCIWVSADFTMLSWQLSKKSSSTAQFPIKA